MEQMTVRFKTLRAGATAPVYKTEGAAGADLVACLEREMTIGAGETQSVPTGIAVEIPPGHAGFIMARSGLARRQGLAPANKVGLIDSDYRGEVLVVLHNHSAEPQTVHPEERIAQLVILPVVQAVFLESTTLEATTRAAGGFGSTGTF